MSELESDRSGMKAWPSAETAGTHFPHLYIGDTDACLEGLL